MMVARNECQLIDFWLCCNRFEQTTPGLQCLT